ncbi:MAG: diaminobutyrate--2-oxoglutarate transaminase, partial [Afipia sp.]|nr:diaminobutyrate--2-oxoglutarate transaminase [Afipia sp.]
RIAAEHDFETRGRGMMRGVNTGSGELASAVTAACFDAGLIIETSGAHDEVIKVLAPLIIDDATLATGLDILETKIREAMAADYAVAAE